MVTRVLNFLLNVFPKVVGGKVIGTLFRLMKLYKNEGEGEITL